jgi:lactoylglutathione lyase
MDPVHPIRFTKINCSLPEGRYAHIAFSLGSKSAVEELTERLKGDGYEVVSGPRTTGDGYYESCIVGVEGNLVEITV